MFKRALIMSASAGNGHVKAAEAIEKTVRQLYPGVEVLNVDTLQYATGLLRQSYSSGYIQMVNKMPSALGWLYDALDTPWQSERRRLAFHRLNTRPLTKLILEYQPDLCISTHFLGSEIVSSLLCRGLIDSLNAVVVTDFDAHGMWYCRHYDRYFVALEQTKFVMGKLGIDPARIITSGIPIDPVFAQFKDKGEMRQKYGLEQDRPVILLSAGGFGVGPMEQIIAELSQLQHPAQIVAMCGRNAGLKGRMQGLADSAPEALTIMPVGYTDQMDEYMSASDILLGKPGGLTTSEALAKRLAFVIVNPIPGQEERNADHLLENGAATRCNDMPALSYKLDQLLGNPRQLELMQNNTARLAHPRSAENIVRELAAMNPVYSGALYAPGHACARNSKRLRQTA